MGRLRRSRLRRWHVLKHLIAAHGWTVGVELGVYKGTTFRYLLENCPGLSLTGVDRFDSHYHESTREGRPAQMSRPDLSACERSLREWAAEHAPGRGHLIRSDTVAAAAQFVDASLDFVFVDADHRYESVLADIDAWRPKVRPGGMMTGHDWNERDFPGVIRAVRERFGDTAAVHEADVWSAPC